MIRIFLLTAALLIPACAQDWASEASALRPQPDPAREQSLLDELDMRAKASLEAIHHARTAQEADSARPGLRRRLKDALGLARLPWPPELKPRITGTLQRQGYRIEKIVFQSLPGVEVPAHLYLPANIAGHAAPAILFYNGHWWPDSKSRPDFQAFNINMARLGFVVFSFDPFGQGERGISQRDHRRTEALLVGVGQQGFAEYESRCALEYLLSRKEVDRERIGMTGASGGGYNTWITSALDDRIKVAVPVVGTSDFYFQLHYTQSLDWYHANEHCHFVPGLIRFADNRELVAMVAPRPTLIINATGDLGFTIGGVYDYGRGLYKNFGAEGKIAYFEDIDRRTRLSAEEAGSSLRMVSEMVDAARRWRTVCGAAHRYSAIRLTGVAMLFRRTEKAAGPGMIALANRLARDLSPAQTPAPSEFFGVSVPAASPVPIAAQRVQRLVVKTESGVELPAFLARPEHEKGLLIAIDDRGKELLASDLVVRRAFEKGWAVCGVDLRGIGELTTTHQGWIFAVSLLLGDNFVWRQGTDLLAMANVVHRSAPYAGLPLGLYARGSNSGMAAMYAIGEAARTKALPLRWYALQDSFLSFRQFLDRPDSLRSSYRLLDDDRREERFTAFDREIPFWYFPFDVLRSFDLPKLLSASSAEGLVIDAIDGDWHPMSAAAAKGLLPSAVKTARTSQLESDSVLLNRYLR